MRRFIDTNILARFYEGDKNALDLILRIKNGDIKIMVPAIVLEEMVWLMTRFFKADKNEIINFQSSVIGMTGATLTYVYNMKLALEKFKKLSIKFNDCVIYTYMKLGDEIISYDKDFDLFDGIKRVEPQDLIG